MSEQLNFIILIGGPGKFESCDPAHDKTWSNYITPIQVAMNKKQIDMLPNEQVEWWVYGPAYRERWTDDVADTESVFAFAQRGRELISARREDIADVKKTGATNYLDRIEKAAGAAGAKFKLIESPAGFWQELRSLPDHSVSRLWYIGHAAGSGFMLKLDHDEKCGPTAKYSDMIRLEDLNTNSSLIKQKLTTPGKPSKFYGCYTKSFAEQWNSLFHTAAEGAISKIDFGLVDRPSKIEQVLPRLEDKAGWSKFGAASSH